KRGRWKWLGSECRGGKAWARRRDIESIEAPPAETAAGWIGHGQLDDTVDLAFRRIAHHSPATVLRIPQAAVRVDARAIRTARLIGGVGEHAFVAHRAGGKIEVVGPDRVELRVRKVHHATVNAPSNAVGGNDAAAKPSTAPIRIEAIERAARSARPVAHGAGPETATTIAAAVIEAVGRHILFGCGDQFHGTRFRVERV